MKSCWKCAASVPDTYRYCLGCGADVDAGPDTAPQDPLLGRAIVGKYRLLEVLGSGAMGTIYKAEQTNLSKEVVIKLLHRHLLSDPELTQRFHREAKAASRLNHPNCVQIIDFGETDDGSLYIAMEYIPGDDLATLLEQHFPIDLRRLIHIFKQVCVALDEAHANGVLHRDLKPENIMVTDRRNEPDFVKVVDFGIAKLEDNNPGSKRSFRTRTGIVCGTPEYMSPEQARGKPLDARSDIYALGIALYHLTTDRLPFDAPSPVEIVTKHLSEEAVPPRTYRPDLPETFDRLILAMMAKDRERRPPSAMDVFTELERIDRELAVERHEEVEQNTYGDATVIDLQPSALLSAAMLDDPYDAPTRETTATNAGARRQLPAAQVTSTSTFTGHGLLDTIPDTDGGIDATKLAAAARERSSRPTPSIRDSRDGRDGGAEPRDAAAPARVGLTRGSDEHKGIREQATINTPPAPGPLAVEAQAPRGRRTVMWLVVGLALAGTLGVATWLVVTALNT